MNNQLIIHAGGHQATLDAVANVPTPPPFGRHYCIPHMSLIERTKHALREGGLEIVNEQHALHTVKDIPGANYFGLFEVESDQKEYNMVIGLRNSHAQMFAASYVIGNRVFVCDNLAFNGEIKIARRHTRFIERDLGGLVIRAMAQLADRRVEMADRIEKYKQAKLPRAEADHAVIELLRARALPSCDVIKVVDEFEKPRHEEHLDADGDRTVWTLFNAVTEVSTKGSNVFALPKRTTALHGVCDLTAARIASGAAPIEGEFEIVEAQAA